jgi:hypothetical protein
LISKLKRENGDGSGTLKETAGAIEKDALDWNPQGARRRGRQRKTLRRTTEEEKRELGKTWSEVFFVGWDLRHQVLRPLLAYCTAPDDR